MEEGVANLLKPGPQRMYIKDAFWTDKGKCWWPFSASGIALFMLFDKQGVRAYCG